MAQKPITLHVISHTHWDREWYLPFQSYRMMLVDLIDRLLGLLDRPEGENFKVFHLDAQTVVLEDYLEIRPQMRDRLAARIQEGRILIGPFYLLSDFWLTSGESIVRNLLLGRRIARSFGVEPMEAGYVADQFGHVSQMPQILRGFGHDNAILGRGVTAGSIGGRSEFYWEAPDGSRVLAHLMVGWYNSAQTFPEDKDKAVAYSRRVAANLGKFASTDNVLGMNGCDHLFAQEHLGTLLPALAQDSRLTEDPDCPICVVPSTMPDFVAALRAAAPSGLTTMHGELREEKVGTLLQGTLISRPEIKTRNTRSQNLLERHAEPLSVLGWLSGGSYDADFLGKAWRYLLQNHPHDSICGCSVNQVHQDMIYRFDAADNIGNNLANTGMHTLARRIDGRDLAAGSRGVLLFNPAATPRSESVSLVINLPVHPGAPLTPFVLRDASGSAVPYQIRRTAPNKMSVLASHFLPYRTEAAYFEITLAPRAYPCVGYELLEWIPLTPENREGIGAPPAAPRPAQTDYLSRAFGHLENEHLAAQILPDGRIDVTHKPSGKEYPGLHYFEDAGDAGESYDYAPPERDEVVSTLGQPARIVQTVNGPFETTYVIETSLNIPIGLTADRKARATERTTIALTTQVTLRAGARHLELETTVETPVARDHILRVLFPTGLARATHSVADSSFDIVSRPIARSADEIYHSGIFSLKGFADIADGAHGLAALTDGLANYSVLDTPRREIVLNFMRATLPVFAENWARFGPDPETFGQGTYTFRYALLPHAGDWQAADLPSEVAAFQNPLRLMTLPAEVAQGDRPRQSSFVTISDSRLALTALKKHETEDRVILRLANLSQETVMANLILGVAPASVEALTLAEQPESDAPAPALDGSVVSLTVPPKKIVTLGLTYPDAPQGGGRRGYAFPFTRAFIGGPLLERT